MKTYSGKCRLIIRQNYGFAFYIEYMKWRAAGYGMGESLKRIREAKSRGWQPIA